MVNPILNILNNYNPNIKFTIELEDNNQSINFLELTIRRDTATNSLITNWFTKPISSGRIINFKSSQPIHQKRAIIYNLIDRGLLLSDISFHKNNLTKIREILINNDYPPRFIDYYMRQRIDLIQKNNFELPPKDALLNLHYAQLDKIVIPYQPGLFENIREVLKEYCILAVPKKLNTNNTITKNKCKTPTLLETDVVYLMECIACSAEYIGQTKLFLKDRMYKHRISSSAHVVGEHRANNPGHNFDFNKPRILHKEPNLDKRRFCEMVEIKLHENTINLQTDTKNLDPSYINVIDDINFIKEL